MPHPATAFSLPGRAVRKPRCPWRERRQQLGRPCFCLWHTPQDETEAALGRGAPLLPSSWVRQVNPQTDFGGRRERASLPPPCRAAGRSFRRGLLAPSCQVIMSLHGLGLPPVPDLAQREARGTAPPGPSLHIAALLGGPQVPSTFPNPVVPGEPDLPSPHSVAAKQGRGPGGGGVLRASLKKRGSGPGEGALQRADGDRGQLGRQVPEGRRVVGGC